MEDIIVKSISEYVAYIEDVSENKKLWYRGVANPSYTPVPGTVWKDVPIQVEGGLEHQFLVSYQSYVEKSNLSAWELYALMQHHGLPTRLLDWSESALVALFFALTSEPESISNRAVWIIDPYELNRKTIGIGHLFCPAIMANTQISESVNLDSYLPINMKPQGIPDVIPENPIAINATQHLRRVSAQKGCFTVNGFSNESIDKFLDGTEHCKRVAIQIGSDQERVKMIRSLANFGIDEEFIYQDLDSLCSKIKREFNVPL